MAFNYSPKIVTDGLVLYLDAANTKSYISGSTTWNDLSRSGFNGTLTNGPTFNTGSGGSIVFDGVDDFVSVPYNPIFNFTTGMTISSWFKTTQTSGGYIITRSETSFYVGFNITPNKIGLFLNGTTGGWLSSVTNVNTGNWFYLTTTWVNGISSIYINGILDVSGSRPGTPQQGNSDVFIGVRPGVNSYNGNISQLSLYNRALTNPEILQNYNATKGRFGL